MSIRVMGASVAKPYFRADPQLLRTGSAPGELDTVTCNASLTYPTAVQRSRSLMYSALRTSVRAPRLRLAVVHLAAPRAVLDAAALDVFFELLHTFLDAPA